MQKYGFVYIWYDRKRKMFYVGCHWGTETDGYVCSSKRMYNAHKRRPEFFKRKILSRHNDKEEMFDEEERVLQLIKEEELGKRYYNLCRHNFKHWSRDPEKLRSISERASESIKALWADPVQREQRMEIFNTKRKGRSEKGHKQHSESMKQVWKSPEHQQLVSSKLSKAMTGMVWWVNKAGKRTRNRVCPGPEWTRGR